MALTNHVYLSPVNPCPKFVTLGFGDSRLFFPCDTHPKVAPNNIALNRFQRESLGLPSSNATFPIVVSECTEKVAKASFMVLEIDHEGQTFSIDIDHQILLKVIKTTFCDQIFVQKQRFWCKYEGRFLKVTILHISRESNFMNHQMMHDLEKCDKARLTETTSFLFVPGNNVFVKKMYRT
jgi:hypothetical protein